MPIDGLPSRSVHSRAAGWFDVGVVSALALCHGNARGKDRV